MSTNVNQMSTFVWLGRALGFMSNERCLHVRHKENTSDALVLMER